MIQLKFFVYTKNGTFTFVQKKEAKEFQEKNKGILSYGAISKHIWLWERVQRHHSNRASCRSHIITPFLPQWD